MNREVVLARILALVKYFVFAVSKSCGMSDAVALASGGKIFTFGSYRLGVHGPGDDIDCLLAVPRHVSHDYFFTKFLPMLQETPGVTEVTVLRPFRANLPPTYLRNDPNILEIDSGSPWG
ncbi:hypothetical protein FRC01_001260, partial [Tulasnella sp. 417]